MPVCYSCPQHQQHDTGIRPSFVCVSYNPFHCDPFLVTNSSSISELNSPIAFRAQGGTDCVTQEHGEDK